MPYSEGWHPYFTLGEKIDNLTMKLPSCSLALLDKADIPTGEFKEDTRFENGRKINDEFINDCFCLEKDVTELQANGSDFINNAHVSLESDNQSTPITMVTRLGTSLYSNIFLRRISSTAIRAWLPTKRPMVNGTQKARPQRKRLLRRSQPILHRQRDQESLPHRLALTHQRRLEPHHRNVLLRSG